MPRSFLVRTRPSADDSSEISHTTVHSYTSEVSRNLDQRSCDPNKQTSSHCLAQQNQAEIPGRSHSSNPNSTITNFNDAYLAVPRPLPTMTSHGRPTSGFLMPSHPNLVPSYPTYSSFGWLPTDSNFAGFQQINSVCYFPRHLSPQKNDARRLAWEYPDPHYSANFQRRLLTGKPSSQIHSREISQHEQRKTTEWPKGFYEDPHLRQQSREERKLTPAIKKVSSVEKVLNSKPTENEKKEVRIERKESTKPAERHLYHSQKSTDANSVEHERNQLPNARQVESDSATKPKHVTTISLLPDENGDEEKKDTNANGDDPEDKPHICKKCGKGFGQLGKLTRHQISHSQEKSHVCTQCNKAFNRAFNLQTHMKTHSDYKPHKCDYCGKGFHQKIDKRIHHYTHTGEKPYKCLKCGRGFKQLTHLNYHMRTHSDERMYHCTYCNKGFNQKGNLQAHIYGHTGERPFKCGVCDKGFTLRSTLNTHIRTHAPKKPFVCEHCNKAFYQKNALKMHHIASHPLVNGKSTL